MRGYHVAMPSKPIKGYHVAPLDDNCAEVHKLEVDTWQAGQTLIEPNGIMRTKI